MINTQLLQLKGIILTTAHSTRFPQLFEKKMNANHIGEEPIGSQHFFKNSVNGWQVKHRIPFQYSQKFPQ